MGKRRAVRGNDRSALGREFQGNQASSDLLAAACMRRARTAVSLGQTLSYPEFLQSAEFRTRSREIITLRARREPQGPQGLEGTDLACRLK